MEKDLISVIIPCYNRVDTIMPCLETVLNQSYKSIEVIIADDGSTDGTQSLFESFSDPRVRYHRYTPNKGACHARNYGAGLSRGEYIAFQDSDDFWHPDKLEKQLSFMLQEKTKFTFCGMNRVSEKGSRYYYPVHGFSREKDPITQLLLENRVGTQTMLMRREVWEEVRFDESFRRYQDWDFALRVAARYKMSYLPEALVDSAVSGSSISSSVKSVPALMHLYQMHKPEFDSRPDCLARYYRRLALRLKNEQPAQAADYYKKCWKLSKLPEDYLSHLLCSFRKLGRARKN